MPKMRQLSREEKLALRLEVADLAHRGQLRLPQAIRQMRNCLGLTQAEFADRFGLTRIQLIALERGRANPTLETLEKICKPFGFVAGFVPREKHSAPD